MSSKSKKGSNWKKRKDRTYNAPAHAQLSGGGAIKPDSRVFWPSRQLGTYRRPQGSV